MKDELQEIQKWLYEGIKYFQEESNLKQDSKEQRIIAYINAIKKIDIMLLERKSGHE